jgi:hypothetical protein
MRQILGAMAFALLATPAAADWLPFSEATSGFSVEFPGTPTISHDTSQKDKDGAPIDTTTYIVSPDNDTALMIDVTDLTKDTVDGGKAIDGAVNAISKDNKKLSDAIVQVDGQAGRAVELEITGSLVDDEIFFVNGRLFQVLTVRSPTASGDIVAEVKHFEQSFHFIPH